MNARRRTYDGKDLPEGLYVYVRNGETRFKYRKPTGKMVYFPNGTKRNIAIEAAILFNNKERSIAAKMARKADKYNKPINELIPKVIKRVIEEENLKENALTTFKHDCNRLVKELGNVYSKSITLEHVNDFLEATTAGKSNNVYNRKISFLKKVFSYLVDMSAMQKNYAADKKTRIKDSKQRKRLTLEEYKLIREAAPEWLQIAMGLCLQTTHATNEVSNMKKSDCKNGYLRVHRKKVQHKETSRVEIPISSEIQKLIDKSNKSGLVCDYIVHRKGRRPNQISEGCNHPLQVSSKMISREFSNVRDLVGVQSKMAKELRATFHEIRALSIHLYTKLGANPQQRAAHGDSKTTKIYQENHIKYVRVPDVELKIG